MRVKWHGQSAFTLGGEEGTVVIDPFGDVGGLRERGIRWEYPPIEASADLVLVTHEHRDHNGAETIGGDPVVIRSRAGRHESPLGEVLGIASEHDEAAGTERGDNTIFKLTLDGLRVVHFGDFGQAELRPEQRQAIGEVDLLLIPVGGGPTLDGSAAAEIALELQPRWVVPMHYRTPRVGFLETEEEFLAKLSEPLRVARSFNSEDLPEGERPLAVVPAAP